MVWVRRSRITNFYKRFHIDSIQRLCKIYPTDMDNLMDKLESHYPDDKELEEVVKAAILRYGKYPNVMGISAGLKLKDGENTGQVGIHFFVTKKLANNELQEKKLLKLPKFVYGRSESGKINRKKRIITDVIEIGEAEFTCFSGKVLEVRGKQGTITLFFRNKAVSGEKYYVITCAHVVGNFSVPPEDNLYIKSGGINKYAKVLKNSDHQGSIILFDIALAELTNEALERLGNDAYQNDCKIIERDLVLQGFMDRNQIRHGISVEWQSGISGYKQGQILTSGGGPGYTIIYFNNVPYKVHNLFLINKTSGGGDSGGIVFKDGLAVGIMVAKVKNGTLFQPIQDALEYLNHRIYPYMDIKVF